MVAPGGQGLLFHCEVSGRSFAKSSDYDENFLNEHVFCRVGNELVKPDLTPVPVVANGGGAVAAASPKLRQHQVRFAEQGP